MDVSHRPGPGFAPAAGERGTAVWTGVAVCWSGLSVLAVLLTSAALLVALALDYGAAGGRDPVVGETRLETGLLHTTDQKDFLPSGAGVRYGERRSAVAVAERPADRPADAPNDGRDQTGHRAGYPTGGRDRGDGR